MIFFSNGRFRVAHQLWQRYGPTVHIIETIDCNAINTNVYKAEGRSGELLLVEWSELHSYQSLCLSTQTFLLFSHWMLENGCIAQVCYQFKGKHFVSFDSKKRYLSSPEQKLFLLHFQAVTEFRTWETLRFFLYIICIVCVLSLWCTSMEQTKNVLSSVLWINRTWAPELSANIKSHSLSFRTTW